MPIKNYSTTAGSNTASPPNGAPIGTTKVSQLDDIQRQVMADIREWYNTPEWRDLGHTPTFVSSTSFTIPTNVTASYIVGQRIRISDSSTLYGTIATSTFSSPNTTVTVTLDSGSITASISAVAVGLSPANDPVPVTALAGTIAEANLPSSTITPAGVIVPYAGTSAPSGWLFCAGQAVSRTTYASLFSAIGTAYGVGDGSTTFNLPDLRGRTVFGLDNMGGSDAGRLSLANTIGTTGGSETKNFTSDSVTLTQANIPALTVQFRTGAAGGTSGISFTAGGVGGATENTIITTPNALGNSFTVSDTGADVLNPAMVLNYIIRT